MGHSQPGDGRGKDKSAQKETDQVRGTYKLGMTEEGQVRTQKESNQARGTHRLETVEGETSQDTESK